MALKHIVLWKLSGETEDIRDQQAKEIKAALEPLKNTIEGILSMSVHRNSAYHDANWHVALVSEFTNLAALEAYQVHPEHVQAAALVRERVTERAAIDFAV